MKKQLGLQKRLIIIFAIFIVTVSILQTVLAGSIVRRAITAKVMELLQNKATTTAEKIDHEIEDLSFWVEGVADPKSTGQFANSPLFLATSRLS